MSIGKLLILVLIALLLFAALGPYGTSLWSKGGERLHDSLPEGVQRLMFDVQVDAARREQHRQVSQVAHLGEEIARIHQGLDAQRTKLEAIDNAIKELPTSEATVRIGANLYSRRQLESERATLEKSVTGLRTTIQRLVDLQEKERERLANNEARLKMLETIVLQMTCGTPTAPESATSGNGPLDAAERSARVLAQPGTVSSSNTPGADTLIAYPRR